MDSISFSPVSPAIKPFDSKSISNSNTPFEAQKSFSSVLKQQIEKINETQLQSDQLTEKLASGADVDLHQVMIASQKAGITLQASLEVRNKVVEAYQEMMRMQV
ncbi:flagellar hook-basal body complex protein FliE [Mesobacillus zeae]|uniref:Flagellar hook-basal body complex protein FliE n=1 Tax=Mesobacillus zeae TaxID=1917180 RepID=A0A398BJS0_9BACI|nr:flagellar hook-basal body complex protein FliE [Mesobacillus zeae]RID87990.1 flagellar hook-basal body complex protein FliE [Mesobacillus zeae]